MGCLRVRDSKLIFRGAWAFGLMVGASIGGQIIGGVALSLPYSSGVDAFCVMVFLLSESSNDPSLRAFHANYASIVF